MKMMSMAVIMKRTSVVVLEDLPSSATRHSPAPPPREVRVRVRLNTASIARGDEVIRGGKRLPMPPPLPTKRFREVDDDDAAASRASKKKQVAEPATRVSFTSTTTSVRPTAQASRTKEEAPVRCAAPRRAIKNCRDSVRSQEIAPMSIRRIVPPPAPARLDALSAQDALSAAISRAHSVLEKRRQVALRREEARRELENMVRTVEFNDPYISPHDVLKP